MRPLILATVLSALALSGCAAYRTTSNVQTTNAPAPSQLKKVEIHEQGQRPARKLKELQKIEVSVKKLTVFHADPTREQANEALIERASAVGADAVVDVQYKKGVGFTTWGYLDASGMAVRFVD